ncbi:MAG: hypothetical protein AAF958_05150 [Planctomycetota bacterium]
MIWNANDGTLVRPIRGKLRPGVRGITVKNVLSNATTNIAFSKDGKQLLVGCQDGDFVIHDADTGDSELKLVESTRDDPLEKLVRQGGGLSVRFSAGQLIPISELIGRPAIPCVGSRSNGAWNHPLLSPMCFSTKTHSPDFLFWTKSCDDSRTKISAPYPRVTLGN